MWDTTAELQHVMVAPGTVPQLAIIVAAIEK
jgi:hypothetical protein